MYGTLNPSLSNNGYMLFYYYYYYVIVIIIILIFNKDLECNIGREMKRRDRPEQGSEDEVKRQRGEIEE